MTITYSVTGMTCGGCVAKVKTTLEKLADTVEVTLIPPEAKLTNTRAHLDALNGALAEVGHYVLQEVVEKSTVKTVNLKVEADAKPEKSWLATYYPLLLIFAFILLVTLSTQLQKPSFETEAFMMHFMAGFFLVFSFFKLLDIKGFASSYVMYDLLAMRVKVYGYIYPFIELGLGIAYLLAWQPTLTNWLTFFVMAFSSLGVIRAVLNKQKIRCACLGAVFNLPMSTVTVIEDLLMAAMALWMIVV